MESKIPSLQIDEPLENRGQSDLRLPRLQIQRQEEPPTNSHSLRNYLVFTKRN